MLSSLKKHLYFLVSGYFAFWAKIVLRRWRPRVIVVTGSSGKTTLFHLIEAQLGDQAVFSHHANSSIGLPFLVLGLDPNIARPTDWLTRTLTAPLRAWRRPPAQKIFVAEADTDRPHEGDFISKFLQPEVSMWVSVYRTHSMNFDRLVRAGKFKTHEEAIAYDFGWFAERAQKLVIANGDQELITNELSRVPVGTKTQTVSDNDLLQYSIKDQATDFKFADQTISLPGLHPRELGQSLQMTQLLMNYLELPFDSSFKHLHMPPGRSSIFKGKKDITIVDSTYNSGMGAMTAILKLFSEYPAQHKWLVVGDILEQGSLEKEEHEKLAHEVIKVNPERVVLLGPRSKEFTLPILERELRDASVVAFEKPLDVLEYLNANLKGGETILFKGVRYLEGVIEQLLADPKDADKLVRRGRAWIKKRQAWGLPR
ncbi:MAG TPA: cyanophycin synthetase [Candidatus Saccharimonadales bacterium]|nr:cyanophycin synthetase [Candidatus Saccharimonadales bacterium]